MPNVEAGDKFVWNVEIIQVVNKRRLSSDLIIAFRIYTVPSEDELMG